VQPVLAEPLDEDAPAGIGRPGTGASGRTEILDAAALSFMEYGFSGATIDDVADRIRATKGRVYHYYRSKIEIFLDVHLRAMAIMHRAVRPAMEAGGDPPTRLRAMAHAHACAIIDNFPYQKVSIQGLEKPLISSRAARPNDLIAKVVEQRDAYEGLFAAVLEEGMRTGHFVEGPPRAMTKPVLGTLNWLTLWYRPELGATPESRAEIADRLADFALRGALRPGVSHG